MPCPARHTHTTEKTKGPRCSSSAAPETHPWRHTVILLRSEGVRCVHACNYRAGVEGGAPRHPFSLSSFQHAASPAFMPALQPSSPPTTTVRLARIVCSLLLRC